MASTIYFKEQDKVVRSISYSDLKSTLTPRSTGLVGIEIPTGGAMQHYFYQVDAKTSELRRYPLRKLGGTYSCMKSYSVLSEAHLFGTPQEDSSPPELPEGSLYFSTEDNPAIDALIQRAHAERLTPSSEAPYFPDLNLTQQQQRFLYTGEPLLKKKPH
jgi:hypothetical protein